MNILTTTRVSNEKTDKPVLLDINSSLAVKPDSFEELSLFVLHFINKLKKENERIAIIKMHRYNLILFCEFISENSIPIKNYSSEFQHLWIDFLKENGLISKSSIRKAQRSIHSFFDFLIIEKIICQSPLNKQVRIQKKNTIISVSRDKYKYLCKVLKERALAGDDKAIRDWALILILGECGLKASEVVNLTLGDLNLEEKKQSSEKLHNNSGRLRVFSKNVERFIPYSTEVANAFELLKEVRKNINLGTTNSSKLFFGYLNISRRLRSDTLQRHGIKFIVYNICTDILGVSYNSENLRNHAIFSWISKGYNTEKIATLAGYTTLLSMERFLNFPEVKITGKKM